MKIVVHNFKDQFALSRSQVEALRELLPKEYFEPIREFHLFPGGPSQSEVFEFRAEVGVVYFAVPVKNKTTANISAAVTELLIGLARIRAKSRFGVPIGAKERERYLPFVEEWKSRCIRALGVANEP